MERWATKPVHQGRARTAATPLHWRVRWATRAAVSRTGGPVPVPALEWRGAGGAPESRCRVQHGSVAGAWAHSPCRRGHWPGQRPDTGRMPTPFLATRDLKYEEQTSELQSLMRKSYAVFCLKKKITIHIST